MSSLLILRGILVATQRGRIPNLMERINLMNDGSYSPGGMLETIVGMLITPQEVCHGNNSECELLHWSNKGTIVIMITTAPPGTFFFHSKC